MPRAPTRGPEQPPAQARRRRPHPDIHHRGNHDTLPLPTRTQVRYHIQQRTAATTTKEQPNAMTNALHSSARIRTSPNKPECPTDPNTAEETRKNLKKPESPGSTISRKTLAIVARPRFFRPEKNSSRKPENCCSPSRPGPARNDPFRPKTCHSTAKTTPKLTKTDHPKRTISSKTLDFSPILPPAEKFAAKLSTQEAKPCPTCPT